METFFANQPRKNAHLPPAIQGHSCGCNVSPVTWLARFWIFRGARIIIADVVCLVTLLIALSGRRRGGSLRETEVTIARKLWDFTDKHICNQISSLFICLVFDWFGPFQALWKY
jgi:hypothetical protein